MATKTRVLVVGGGYAGIVGALRAKRRLGARAEVTLVSATDRFVERIRLHEALASGAEVSSPLARRVEGTGVELVIARATHIDAAAKQLALEGRSPLRYGALLIATGSMVDTSHLPGAREHAAVLEPHTANQLHARVRALPSGTWVTVVGAGLTGLEAASELAEQRPDLRVRLISGSPLGEGLAKTSAAHVLGTLSRMGVEVLIGERVERVEHDGVRLGGKLLASGFTLVAPGFVAPPLARSSGLPVDEACRLRVDEALRVIGVPSVYAAGDGAHAVNQHGQALPLGCKSALPTGVRAAETLVADLLGRPAEPLHYRETVYCLSLGRHDGILQPMTAAGLPRSFAARGRLGAHLKARIVQYTLKMLEGERAAAARAASRARSAELRTEAVRP